MRTVSLPALRRLLVTAQGYVPRVRRAGADEVESAIRRASCIQLDSVATVERTHRIAIASRAGLYPPGTVPGLLREGRIIEYWPTRCASSRPRIGHSTPGPANACARAFRGTATS